MTADIPDSYHQGSASIGVLPLTKQPGVTDGLNGRNSLHEVEKHHQPCHIPQGYLETIGFWKHPQQILGVLGYYERVKPQGHREIALSF